MSEHARLTARSGLHRHAFARTLHERHVGAPADLQAVERIDGADLRCHLGAATAAIQREPCERGRHDDAREDHKGQCETAHGGKKGSSRLDAAATANGFA